MEVNFAASQVLNAFLQKWKAEEALREADAGLRKLLGRPPTTPFKRPI